MHPNSCVGFLLSKDFGSHFSKSLILFSGKRIPQYSPSSTQHRVMQQRESLSSGSQDEFSQETQNCPVNPVELTSEQCVPHRRGVCCHPVGQVSAQYSRDLPRKFFRFPLGFCLKVLKGSLPGLLNLIQDILLVLLWFLLLLLFLRS